MSNREGPHQATVLVKWENCERLPNGQNSNRVTTRGSKLFHFNGKDHNEAEEKVMAFIKKVTEEIINEQE